MASTLDKGHQSKIDPQMVAIGQKTRSRHFRAYVRFDQLRTCLAVSLPPLCARSRPEQVQQCAWTKLR